MEVSVRMFGVRIKREQEVERFPWDPSAWTRSSCWDFLCIDVCICLL